MVIAELNLKVEELENEKVVEEEKVKEVMCSIQSETKVHHCSEHCWKTVWWIVIIYVHRVAGKPMLSCIYC